MGRLTPSKRNVFGDILRDARAVKGWTLIESSKRLGCSFSYLATIERGGDNKIKMALIESICALYDLPLDDICIAAEKIPSSVFYKVIDNPQLIDVIRKYEV
jgi:transcriptional regulator with XRE-family HTH domain